jgi:hypothetical protein
MGPRGVFVSGPQEIYSGCVPQWCALEMIPGVVPSRGPLKESRSWVSWMGLLQAAWRGLWVARREAFPRRFLWRFRLKRSPGGFTWKRPFEGLPKGWLWRCLVEGYPGMVLWRSPLDACSGLVLLSSLLEEFSGSFLWKCSLDGSLVGSPRVIPRNGPREGSHFGIRCRGECYIPRETRQWTSPP